MRITLQLAFDEKTICRLLNFVAHENRYILMSNPDLPGLYESGVKYEREGSEVWCDYLNMLTQGHEDCDGLACARAGELLARGYKALSPGDGGYAAATKKRLASIRAEVFLRTRSKKNGSGLYHCIVRYRVGKKWYVDDPSARLGMNSRRSQ